MPIKRPTSTSCADNPARLNACDSSAEPPLSRALVRVVDGALAAAVIGLPWCMGGRHPLGELVLAVCALVGALAWMARAYLEGRLQWTRSPAGAIYVLAAALLVGQIMPLPRPIVQVLSPHLGAYLPLWTSDAAVNYGLGTWNHVSVNPTATSGALAVLLAYGLLFFTAVERVRSLQDVERMLRLIAFSTTITAAFGLVQYLTSNGKFLWFYEHPYRQTFVAATGMFINKNHFAHLLALGVGPLVWLVTIQVESKHLGGSGLTSRTWRTLAAVLALAVVVFAGLMSLSRGGIVMMALAAAVSGGALYRARLLSGKSLALAASLVALVGGSLAIHGQRAVADRLSDYTSGSLAQLDQDGGRRAIWTADIRALADYFVFGSGAGTHRDVYPIYLSAPFPTEFTHAESGYLQIALECGTPGLALLATGLGCLGYWCASSLVGARSGRHFACTAAVAASLLVSVTHSLVDFVWYIPSCAATALMLAACALRLWQMNRPQSTPADFTLHRPLVLASTAALVLLGAWMIEDRLCAAVAAPHWDHYLKFALSSEAQTGQAAASLETIGHLEQVARWTPGDARAHLNLAEACLSHFERAQADSASPMPLAQIRDAALASRFESRSALDQWLVRALGDRRRFLDMALWHTLQALLHCPFEGQAYIYLGELCFLNTPDQAAKGVLVDQALRVRPNSAPVAMCAGSEAALAGDWPRALEHWRRAFHCGPAAQRQLIEQWATAGLPASLIVGAFQPDLRGVRLIEARYGQADLAPDLATLWEYHARLAELAARESVGAPAASLWIELQDVYRRLGKPDQERLALQQAAAQVEIDYRTRLALADAFCRHREFQQAEDQLRWCLARNPDDERARGLMATAVKGRIDLRRASVSNAPSR